MVLRDLFKSHRLWLIIAAACLVPGALSSLTGYLNSRLAGRSGWADATFAASRWLVLAVLSLIPYILARRFPLKRDGFVRAMSVHFTAAVVLSLCWALASLLISLPLVRRPAQTSLLRDYENFLLTNLPASVFLYFAILACIYAFSYYREAREREAQQSRLAVQLAEARLGALRMQLNPHFLFNSLNAITVLVRDQDTPTASRMLELLSGILRQVLHSDKRKEITLNEELQFIEKYLAIEQVRFSDRLQVHWSIASEVRDTLVPEFILQPLVENAIRHGVSKRSNAGVIEIKGWESNGELVLIVQDDGPGVVSSAGRGIGLLNTRARLETLFGTAGKLELANAEGGGAIAILRLPSRRSGNG